MNFLERLAQGDIAAFYFVNDQLYYRPLADSMVFFAHDEIVLCFLFIGGLMYYWYAGKRKLFNLVGWAALAILISNLLHNQWLKPFFNRERPFMTLPATHLSAPLYDLSTLSLSFPSTHAASAVALAVVVIHLDRRLWWFMLLLVMGISGGAIYSGGHYPADVLAGYVLGFGIGWAVIFLRRLLVAETKPVPAKIKKRKAT